LPTSPRFGNRVDRRRDLMPFQPEPSYSHGTSSRTAVLLVNLGSPDEPTASATRRYLAEFLSDPRVVEIPRFVWWLVLNGIILNTRPAKSAAKYATIWTPEGSPLVVGTARLQKLLQGYLGERGLPVLVRHAMRYGNPSVASALDALRAEGATRVLVLPLYPQYAAATTASVWDAVALWSQRARQLPEFRFVNRYGDEPLHIAALAGSVRAFWQREGRSRMLVMSFHGLPERSLHLGDPYHCECHKTARLLAEALGLAQDQYRVTFQSRFGKAQWLRPYTEPTLKELAAAGIDRVDVVCPGFAVDCLETLEEIAQEARDAFLESGGREFHYIPCLNDDADGVRALVAVVERHLAGWPVPGPQATADGRAQRERALAMGATD
jgi:protoporphyrin/coproporphyrin ferrochelatase